MKPDLVYPGSSRQSRRRGHFEEEWPPLAARLHRRLSTSCPDPFERSDVVEETRELLSRIWHRTPDRKPWPLVLSIALNVQKYAHRTWQEAPESTSGESSDSDSH